MTVRRKPRDDLIEMAAKLFYERGLPNVGINEVTRHARVARMTLYNNFESKEALALAAFERVAAHRRAAIEAELTTAKTPLDAILGVFDVAGHLVTKARFRGCAFVNLALQEPNPKGPTHALVRTHKLWIKESFRELAVKAKAKHPEELAQQLLALWDGGLVEAYIQGSAEPVTAARSAAETLFTAATPDGAS